MDSGDIWFTGNFYQNGNGTRDFGDAKIQSSNNYIFILDKSLTPKTAIEIESYNINHNCIETGNLLFCNNKNSKKNKIVFAVTLKSFEGLRYLGFEMYYEFLENLNHSQ